MVMFMCLICFGLTLYAPDQEALSADKKPAVIARTCVDQAVTRAVHPGQVKSNKRTFMIEPASRVPLIPRLRVVRR